MAYHFLGVSQVGKLNEKSHIWYYLASVSLKKMIETGYIAPTAL